jgi:DNA-directed RNA polymerase subunit RPC12/RpoP
MEQTRSIDERDLVRCLDCKTIYSRPVADDEAGPCPTCGYVGWIALKPRPEPSKGD